MALRIVRTCRMRRIVRIVQRTDCIADGAERVWRGRHVATDEWIVRMAVMRKIVVSRVPVVFSVMFFAVESGLITFFPIVISIDCATSLFSHQSGAVDAAPVAILCARLCGLLRERGNGQIVRRRSGRQT